MTLKLPDLSGSILSGLGGICPIVPECHSYYADRGAGLRNRYGTDCDFKKDRSMLRGQNDTIRIRPSI